MVRNLLILLAVVIGIKFGVGYLFSNEFEAYATRENLPWTCYFENATGQIHIIMSDYDKAYARFQHTVDRCPGTSMDEEAEYGLARSLEGMGRRPAAVEAYRAFVLKYPGTKRARTADRAADLIKGS